MQNLPAIAEAVVLISVQLSSQFMQFVCSLFCLSLTGGSQNGEEPTVVQHNNVVDRKREIVNYYKTRASH
jgi:hypothetical protein